MSKQAKDLHPAVVAWCAHCVKRGRVIPFKEWRNFTMETGTIEQLMDLDAQSRSLPEAQQPIDTQATILHARRVLYRMEDGEITRDEAARLLHSFPVSRRI